MIHGQNIPIKPLSVNEAYRGRRFSTPEKKVFTKTVGLMLRSCKIPDGPLEIHYRFGVLSVSSDVDNCIKVFQDCLQKKYGFNDSRIFRIVAEKEVVICPYIEFQILLYKTNERDTFSRD